MCSLGAAWWHKCLNFAWTSFATALCCCFDDSQRLAKKQATLTHITGVTYAQTQKLQLEVKHSRDEVRVRPRAVCMYVPIPVQPGRGLAAVPPFLYWLLSLFPMPMSASGR